MTGWDRLNLALGALAALLLAALLWWPTGQTLQPLIAHPAGEVNRIHIEREQRPVLTLQRSADDWHLRYPEDHPARAQRVGQLLAIRQAPVAAVLDGDRPAAEFGLQTPQAVLQFDDQRLLFGDRDFSQRRRYVQHEGRIHLIDEVYFNLLALPPAHYRLD